MQLQMALDNGAPFITELGLCLQSQGLSFENAPISAVRFSHAPDYPGFLQL